MPNLAFAALIRRKTLIHWVKRINFDGIPIFQLNFIVRVDFQRGMQNTAVLFFIKSTSSFEAVAVNVLRSAWYEFSFQNCVLFQKIIYWRKKKFIMKWNRNWKYFTSHAQQIREKNCAAAKRLNRFVHSVLSANCSLTRFVATTTETTAQHFYHR